MKQKSSQRKKKCDQEASSRKPKALPGEVNNMYREKNRKQDREEHYKDRTD